MQTSNIKCNIKTTSDVTKLVKIRIHQMQMQMQIKAFVLSVGKCCNGLGQFNDCNNVLFPKVNKISVHISTV